MSESLLNSSSGDHLGVGGSSDNLIGSNTSASGETGIEDLLKNSSIECSENSGDEQINTLSKKIDDESTKNQDATYNYIIEMLRKERERDERDKELKK